ncbi:MAG: hypothetical protein BWX56_01493 [Euryarchaeota archaeon ADurb.Bin023]|nr:MAG: hypothetical protein BWX56_01493 [Euryarchaeota archaeon ADurb.Bin023]
MVAPTATRPSTAAAEIQPTKLLLLLIASSIYNEVPDVRSLIVDPNALRRVNETDHGPSNRVVVPSSFR